MPCNHEIFTMKINNFENLECFTKILCLKNLELYGSSISKALTGLSHFVRKVAMYQPSNAYFWGWSVIRSHHDVCDTEVQALEASRSKMDSESLWLSQCQSRKGFKGAGIIVEYLTRWLGTMCFHIIGASVSEPLSSDLNLSFVCLSVCHGPSTYCKSLPALILCEL